jgi:hypothetical protein
MKTLKLPESSYYLLCLFTTALLLAMTPLITMAMSIQVIATNGVSNGEAACMYGCFIPDGRVHGAGAGQIATINVGDSVQTGRTTTTAVKLPDVGILGVYVPVGILAGETNKVEVLVKNFSKKTQTRSLSLTLNEVPVSESPVSVTLTKNETVTVKFDVLFEKPGVATLTARSSPGDVNPANDTNTEIKVIGPWPGI